EDESLLDTVEPRRRDCSKAFGRVTLDDAADVRREPENLLNDDDAARRRARRRGAIRVENVPVLCGELHVLAHRSFLADLPKKGTDRAGATRAPARSPDRK